MSENRQNRTHPCFSVSSPTWYPGAKRIFVDRRSRAAHFQLIWKQSPSGPIGDSGFTPGWLTCPACAPPLARSSRDWREPIGLILLLLCSVSCRGAVAEGRVRGGPVVREELPGHLLRPRRLQRRRRGLRLPGGALPKRGGRVRRRRSLPLPRTGHHVGGTHTHTRTLGQLVLIVTASFVACC